MQRRRTHLTMSDIVATLYRLLAMVDAQTVARRAVLCGCGVCPACEAREVLERWEHGRRTRGSAMPHHRGEANPRAKLTLAQVQDIRRRAAAGERRISIRRDYPGVCGSVISDVINRRTWDVA